MIVPKSVRNVPTDNNRYWLGFPPQQLVNTLFISHYIQYKINGSPRLRVQRRTVAGHDIIITARVFVIDRHRIISSRLYRREIHRYTSVGNALVWYDAVIIIIIIICPTQEHVYYIYSWPYIIYITRTTGAAVYTPRFRAQPRLLDIDICLAVVGGLSRTALHQQQQRAVFFAMLFIERTAAHSFCRRHVVYNTQFRFMFSDQRRNTYRLLLFCT